MAKNKQIFKSKKFGPGEAVGVSKGSEGVFIWLRERVMPLSLIQAKELSSALGEAIPYADQWADSDR